MYLEKKAEIIAGTYDNTADIHEPVENCWDRDFRTYCSSGQFAPTALTLSLMTPYRINEIKFWFRLNTNQDSTGMIIKAGNTICDTANLSQTMNSITCTTTPIADSIIISANFGFEIAEIEVLGSILFYFV